MRLAKGVFTAAGIYGLLLVTPMYFLGGEVQRRFGTLVQPLWYYGFVGVTVTYQLAYLLIGRDPARYRPLMPIAMLAKLSFGIAALTLYLRGLSPGQLTAVAMPDLIWVALFAWAYVKTPKG
jgi:hypothetical protein